MLGVQQVHHPMQGAAVVGDIPFVGDLTSQCKEEHNSYQKQK